MIRLTVSEEKRASALCMRAWDWLLRRQISVLPVELEDLRLLIKAGGELLYYRQTTLPGKGKKKKKSRTVWQAEVEYKGHRFIHEDTRYFFVPKPRKPWFPWGP
jgi:hypothetical protein